MEIDGRRYECSHVEPTSVTLQPGAERPAERDPCDAVVVVDVDGETDRRDVFLPEGINCVARIAVERR